MDVSPQQAFANRYQSNIENYRKDLDRLRVLLEESLADAGIDAIVTARVKKLDSALAKFKRKYEPALDEPITEGSIASSLTDLFGLRIIVPYASVVARCKEPIEKCFHVASVSDKTATRGGTETFGYIGLHFDCRLGAARRSLHEYSRLIDQNFEVQVRSLVQHSWSELDHKLKYKKSIDDKLSRRVSRLAAVFELADQEFDDIRNSIEEQESQAIASSNSNPSGALNAFVVVSICNAEFPGFYHLSDWDGEAFMAASAHTFVRPLHVEELKTAVQRHFGRALLIYQNAIRMQLGVQPFMLPMFAVFEEDEFLFVGEQRKYLAWIRELWQKHTPSPTLT